MNNMIKKMREDKQEYRAHMARVAALPEDYQFVYHKINDYMWSFAAGSGMDMLKTQYELIDFLESGVANKKHVLEVTGDDVALFCEELIRDNKLWMDQKRRKLNKDIMNLRKNNS